MAIKFVAYITLKNGVRLYARQFGKRAFPIEVEDSDKKEEKVTEDKKTTPRNEE